MDSSDLDLPAEMTVKQARESYHRVLVHWGLESFTAQQLSMATTQLRGADNLAALTEMDVQFQAAMTRLQARPDLRAADVAVAFKELLGAEHELDQADWEQDCDRAARMEHAHYKGFAKPAPDKSSPSR